MIAALNRWDGVTGDLRLAFTQVFRKRHSTELRVSAARVVDSLDIEFHGLLSFAKERVGFIERDTLHNVRARQLGGDDLRIQLCGGVFVQEQNVAPDPVMPFCWLTVIIEQPSAAVALTVDQGLDVLGARATLAA